MNDKELKEIREKSLKYIETNKTEANNEHNAYKTILKLLEEISVIKSKNEKLKDQIHSGYGGNS